MSEYAVCHTITKYDPADFGAGGSYAGAEDSVSDHGPVESAYLEAVAAFVQETGVRHLTIREPQITGLINFGLEAPVAGHGLAGLFPPDLTGYHDGAEVPVEVGLELVRAMLRDNGAWCRLEVEGKCAVHVGFDQYVYVSSEVPCEGAVARTRALGLFPMRIQASPYVPDFEDHSVEQRPADDDFWRLLHLTVSRDGTLLLEEGYVANDTRWHRLTRTGIEDIRAGLAPRAWLTVWPDFLSHDVDAVLGALPEEYTFEFVMEDAAGRISSVIADEALEADLRAHLAGARAVGVRPSLGDEHVPEHEPLFTAVLPDDDGVLRARWGTSPTPSDIRWSALHKVTCGEVRTGTVTSIAPYGVFVDIGGTEGMINAAELSWQPFGQYTDVVEVGQEVTAEVLDVDLARERISLSRKALLEEDPLPSFVPRVGEIVSGRVTKLVPFGAFVRIGGGEDGFEGLVHNSELAEGTVARPEDVVAVGDELVVKITQVDRERHRMALSHRQTFGPSVCAPEEDR
ncbi:S1 RNA-binding domain-containing protein [Streptomyces sp. NBC_01230]|uniref:S1 RNA-binding domain-containing protein n=1 Tax=Streptomyces sp. NBC_01230 TaxID=2903784 RepID=UPI002E1352E8|nr:S1 RNA-binding domain-containing protein [Streptomyces sp. NBC_01230]